MERPAYFLYQAICPAKPHNHLVETRRIELLSESTATQASPSAVCIFALKAPPPTDRLLCFDLEQFPAIAYENQLYGILLI